MSETLTPPRPSAGGITTAICVPVCFYDDGVMVTSLMEHEEGASITVDNIRLPFEIFGVQ